MPDRCQHLRDRLDDINDQLEALEEILKSQQESGDFHGAGETRRQIKQLLQERGSVKQRLAACEKTFVIVGTEFTQAVQYWNVPSGQGSGYAAQNSVPLISRKATAIRVYIDGGREPVNLVGTLKTVSGAGEETLVAVNNPISAKPLTSIERKNLSGSMNFIITAEKCIGNLYCSISVSGQTTPPINQVVDFSLKFSDMPALEVWAILIHYKGLNYYNQSVDVQASLQGLTDGLDYVRRTYPIGELRLVGCQVLEWGDGQTTRLADRGTFGKLHADLATLRAQSGSNAIYLGLYPQAAGCGGVCGLGGNGTALAPDQFPNVTAHEIGHALGAPGDNNSAYPTYDSYPPRSIGECGLDTNNFTIFDPETIFDFLHYAPSGYVVNGFWVSPYTYLNLKNVIASKDTPKRLSVAARVSEPGEMGETLYVKLRIHRRGARRIELIDGFHLRGQTPLTWPGRPCDVVLDLLAANGNIIDVQECMLQSNDAVVDPPFRDVATSFRIPPGLSAIRVVQNDEPLATFEIARDAPKVQIVNFSRKGPERAGDSERRRLPDLARVEWSVDEPKDAPAAAISIRFSNDDGRTWRALATGCQGTKHLVDLSVLPGGDRCRLQVVASKDLRTAVIETEPFVVERKPRRPYILKPHDGDTYQQGSPVVLVGAGFSSDFGSSEFGEVVWECRTVGRIAIGPYASVFGLPVGRHRIVMCIEDGIGGEASASVEIQVIAPRSTG